MKDWASRLPKVELHLHLEGAIPLSALWQLMQRHGGDPDTPDLPALERRFRFRDFRGFLAAWIWKNRFLRDADDLAFAAEQAALALADQQVRYVEASCSPPDFPNLSTGEVVAAIRRGLDRVPGVQVSLIVDLVRDHGPQRAERTAAQAGELVKLGVVAVGLGGSEQPHPPEPFAPAFALARRKGLHCVAHAGETAGPASIRGALAIGAERLGHGIRCLEDPGLVAELRRRRIPLEVCLTSNVRTGVVDSLPRHPLPHLLGSGLRVVLGSDDPALFGSDLSNELRLAEYEFGLDRQQIAALQREAAEASFLPTQERNRLLAILAADPG